jgi:hypothetical protein
MKKKLQIVFRSRTFRDILILFILSLTPLLWYKTSHSLAIGHDLFFPLDPNINFFDRLYYWSGRFVFGVNQLVDFGTLPIHLLDMIVYSFGFSVQTTQKIIFIFWFFIPGLAAYSVSRVIGMKNTIFRLFPSVFVMYNHFMLQGWFIAERTKFSVVAGTLFTLAILIALFEHRIRLKTGLLLSAIVFLLFNGGSPPLYGGFLIVTVVTTLFYAFHQKVYRSKKTLIYFGLVCSSLLAIFIITNLYWIFPTFQAYRTSYSSNVAGVGGVSGVQDWVDTISKNTSIFNLIRLQGIPDWDPMHHPYAGVFLLNPVFIAMSFLLPFLAFTPLLFAQKKPYYRYIILFSILALISIPFTAGSHPPFGTIFNAMLRYIPGFIIFRSSFYKFAYGLWIAYAFLIPFGIHIFVEYAASSFRKGMFHSKIFSFKDILSPLVTFLAIVLVLIYNFPYFTGSFFSWNPPFSTMVEVPDYIYDFRDWLKQQDTISANILFLPELHQEWKTDNYNWNYWSFSPLTSMFSDKAIILNDHSVDGDLQVLLDTYYSALRKNDSQWQRLNNYVGADYIVLRKDFLVHNPEFQSYAPQQYQAFLTEYAHKIKTFGEWEVYSLKQSPTHSVISTSSHVVRVNTNDQTQLKKAMSFGAINNYETIINNPLTIYPIDTYTIYRCDICWRSKLTLQLPKLSLLPDSLFYFLVKSKEQKEHAIAKNDPSTFINYNLGLTIKRIAEVRSLRDFNRPIKYAIPAIDQYINLLAEIDSVIEKMPEGREKQELLYRVITVVGEEKLLMLRAQFSGSYNLKEFQDKLFKLYDAQDIIYERYIKTVTLYEKDNERSYIFQVDADGEYIINVDTVDFARNNIMFELDGETKETRITDVGGLYSLGRFVLKKGQHTLLLHLTSVVPLLETKNDQLMFNEGNNSCQEYALYNLQSGKHYALSIRYRTAEADLLTSRLSLTFANYNKKAFDVGLRPSIDWNDESVSFEVPDKADSATLQICPPTYAIQSSITLDIASMTVKQFFAPYIVVNANTTAISMASPSIDWKKINQTKYQVRIKNATKPFYLVFRNRFDPGWQLLDSNGSEIPTHEKGNFFANTWFIDKKGDYTLSISFKGQEKQPYYYLFPFGMITILLFACIYERKN